MDLRPICHKGDRVAAGQILTEGYSTENGELALGKNLKVAFMPWKGYNYEDAIVLNERVVREDILTSVHVDEYSLEVRETKRGMEELTSDIPNVSEEATKDLDERGIIRVGAHVNPGDIMTLNNYSYYLSLRNEHLDKAEKMISTALSADPNNSTFLDTYAWVLFKSKNYSLAKFYMRSAIENEKNPSGVLYEHYGDILFMNGEKEEAVKMWQKALEFRDEECGDLKYKIENGLPVDHEK